MLLCLLWTSSFATVQCPDTLIYKDERLPMEAEGTESPLEVYFEAGHPRPEFDLLSTCHWRGYEAFWEIRDGYLYLASIDAGVEGEPVSLSDIDPGWRTPVKAWWFSGMLKVTGMSGGDTRMQVEVRHGKITSMATIESE